MFRVFRLLWAVVCTLAGVGPLGAGEGDLRALARPALRSYAQRDGLPHHTVHQISRDAKGRLWAATQGGVAVFSGRRWTPLPLPPEATTAYVRSVVEDHQGTLWVGTHEDGVWQWRQGQWTGLGSAAGLPDPRVNQLCEAPEPGGGWRVWAATAAGPARWDEDHWTPCLAGLETPWAWRLVSAPDLQGNRVLWACTRGGLARWVEDRWILEPAFRGLEVNDLLALPGEEGQALWVSCFGKGLARWTRQGPAFLGRPQGLPLAFPVSLAATRDAGGRPVLWVGTYNDGLAYLREGRWFLLTTTHGLRSLGVYTLLPDPAGRPALWMGMQGGGVASLSTEGWMSLQFRSSGFPGVGVTCFQETREEEGLRLWIGTQRGLVWLDGSRWRTEDVRQGLPGSEIRALAAMEGTPSPRLVAATDKGLAERVGGRWRALPSPPGEVRLLLSSRGGTGLWVATSAGLVHRAGDGWVAAEGWEGPPPDALALAESQDPEGGHSLWVGTRGNGLWRSQKGRWSRFDPMPRYPRNWITSLRVGKGPPGRPRLWVGTRGPGLARLDLWTPGAPWHVCDARGPGPGRGGVGGSAPGGPIRGGA